LIHFYKSLQISTALHITSWRLGDEPIEERYGHCRQCMNHKQLIKRRAEEGVHKNLPSLQLNRRYGYLKSSQKMGLNYVIKVIFVETMLSCLLNRKGYALPAGPLPVSIWRVFPSSVQLDWFISLADKYEMVDCDLSYGAEDEDGMDSEVDNFMPEHRSFSVAGLLENTSYWLVMACRDREDIKHHSPVLRFTTGVSEVIAPLVLEKLASPLQKNKESSISDLRSRTDVLSAHRFRGQGRWSPHTIMGVATGGAGLIILALTAGLFLNRYRSSGHPLTRIDLDGWRSSCSSLFLRPRYILSDEEILEPPELGRQDIQTIAWLEPEATILEANT